ncbi:hypothetical protein ACIA8K_03535 [Catenuloplanes sp. NPDC051500]|uniref:hypothetical protein n=1 Tax=Catenuloplanes sp. NPDC051500 TaxID=3363959 RepID=UPI00379EADC9
MAVEHEDSPVRHFCAQLDAFVRAAGQTRSYVVSRHPMSDSQVYAVLAGTVKTPPSFDRMVMPIIGICGGDTAVTAQWRSRHDTMVRVYELQKSLRRKTVTEPAPEPGAGAGKELPGFDVPEGYNRFGTVDPRPVRRWRWPLLIAAIVAVTGVLAGGLTWAFVANRNEPSVTGLAAPPAGGATDSVAPQADSTAAAETPCTAGPPAPGGDLLDVARPDATSDQRFDAWWSNSDLVRLGDFTTHGWTATAQSGAGLKKWDMLVIRGCLPVTSGHGYTLSFTAKASVDATIGVRVQGDQPPWDHPSLMETIPVSTEPQQHTYRFTGAMTSRSSELTFQMGGNPALSVEITDVVLTDLGA